MADSIKEKILKSVTEDLGIISMATGYSNDIQLVERWEQLGQNKASLPAIFVHTGSEAKENRPSIVTHCKLVVYAVLWAIHDRNAFPVPTDEYLNLFAADIEKALMVDEQRDQLAERTTVTDIDFFELQEGQAFVGVIVEMSIEYKHKRGDPYTQL